MPFNTNPPSVDYITGISQTTFPFLFKVYEATDLNVYHTPKSTGLTTLLLLGVDYTVAILGDAGGDVKLKASVTPGDFLAIKRVLPINRYAEYQTSGDLLAKTLNDDQDYQTYLIGDTISKFSSSISAPPGVPGFNGQLPAPIPEAYLRWSLDGRSLTNDITPPTWRTETEALKDLAEKWAENPEDLPVIPGKYSAHHWAIKAQSVSSLNPHVASLTVAGMPISPRLSNPNFIINGDFKVNQRGQTLYNGAGARYSVDRWKRTGYSDVTVKAGGGISGDNNNNDFIIMQPIEITEGTPLVGVGKKITVSFDAHIHSECNLRVIASYNTNIGVQVIGSKDFGVGNGNVNRYSMTFDDVMPLYPIASALTITFDVEGSLPTTGDSILPFLSNVKVEAGEIATPFEPRPIGLELMLCQRYYQVYPGQIYLYMFQKDGTKKQVSMPRTTTMRATPTETYAMNGGGSVDISYSSAELFHLRMKATDEDKSTWLRDLCCEAEL